MSICNNKQSLDKTKQQQKAKEQEKPEKKKLRTINIYKEN